MCRRPDSENASKSNHLRKATDYSLAFSDRDTHRFGWAYYSCSTRKLCKGEVTKHILAEDQRPNKMSLIDIMYANTNFRLTVEWLDSGHQKMHFNAVLLQHSPKLIARNMLSPDQQNMQRQFLAYSQDFSKTHFRVKICSLLLRPGQKLHWPSPNFDSTIF